jgi:hypothetical protein
MMVIECSPIVVVSAGPTSVRNMIQSPNGHLFCMLCAFETSPFFTVHIQEKNGKKKYTSNTKQIEPFPENKVSQKSALSHTIQPCGPKVSPESYDSAL